MLQSDKEIDFSVTTLTHSDIVWMIQSGSKSASGTYTVQKSESIQCVGTTTLTVVGTPKGTSAIAIDETGKQFVGTVVGKVVSIVGGISGAWYNVLYACDVTGDILDLNSNSMPHNFYVEMRTIAYTTNNVVIGDIFIIFKNAIANGELKGTFEAGKNEGDTIKFTALTTPNSNEIAKYIFIPRI